LYWEQIISDSYAESLVWEQEVSLQRGNKMKYAKSQRMYLDSILRCWFAELSRMLLQT
jgi:hypothetical protein